MTTITSITDLLAAVRGLRPDAAAVGVEVTIDHVREAALGAGPYEDLDAETIGDIADRAVELALDANPREDLDAAATAAAKVPQVDLGAEPIWLDELAAAVADRLQWTSVIVDEGVGLTEAWGARHVHHDYVLEVKGIPARAIIVGFAHALPADPEMLHCLEEVDGCTAWLRARIDRLTMQRMDGLAMQRQRVLSSTLWRFRADVSLATEVS